MTAPLMMHVAQWRSAYEQTSRRSRPEKPAVALASVRTSSSDSCCEYCLRISTRHCSSGNPNSMLAENRERRAGSCER